jgi:hypothetical protein
MPSVQALSKMSAKALENHIEKAGSLPINGVTFTSADVAADYKFEPSANLDSLLSSLIESRGVSGTVDLLGSNETAFKLVWDHLDDNYTYYNTNVNDAFIDLGIAYADYLLDGGERLLDIAKFTPDNGDADTAPERSQTLHDNILGNFDELSIADKFGAGAGEIFERIDEAGLGALLGELGNYADGRGVYSGNDTASPTQTILFDQMFFG